MKSLALIVIGALLATPPAAAQRGGGDIKPGPWNTASKVPDGFVVHETRNYQVQSQAGIEKAKRLGEHMEVMNSVYRGMFPPGKGGAKRQTIKLLKDREAFRAYGAPAGAGAYYSPTEREMVCYDTGKWSDEEPSNAPETGAEASKGRRRLEQLEELMKMDILGAAAHEGWHQYFHWYVTSFVELPSWLNEGMGDYFYTASPKPGRGNKKKADLGGMNGMRMAVLKAALRQNRLIPIEELLRMSKAQYYSNASLCYAQGWGLCQFLLHSGNKKYADVIPKFVRLVRDDTNMAVVTDKTFKGIDLAKLHEEWVAWLGKQALLPEEEVEGDGDGAGSAPGSAAGDGASGK